MSLLDQAANNVLLRELHTRFPEVPTEVVCDIMRKSAYNRERCIETLARECQKYQHVLYGSEDHNSPAAYIENYLHQRSNSNDSRGSLSSISSSHSAGTPAGHGGHLANQMSPADVQSSMRGSLSYPYLPPTDLPNTGGHNQGPRSSLPTSKSDYLPPNRLGFGGIPEDCASASPNFYGTGNPFAGAVAADVSHNQSTTFNTYNHPCPENLQSPLVTGGFPTYNRTPPSGTFPPVDLRQSQQPPDGRHGGPPPSFGNQKSVTSEINYMVGVAGENMSCAQSIYVPKPSYMNVSVFPAPSSDTSPQTGQRSSSRPPSVTDPSNQLSVMQPTSTPGRSPNVYSALYINPLQAWVNNPQRPATFISSASSSCESLLTAGVPTGQERRPYANNGDFGANNVPFRQNGTAAGSRPGSGSSAPCDDISYIQALRVCQAGNLENLTRRYQESLRHLQELRSLVGHLEAEFRKRQYDRSQAFPTVDDVEKLRNDNGQLRLEIQQLTREIDLANDGEMPLGELNPNFYRRDSLRNRGGLPGGVRPGVTSQSSSSSNTSVQSPHPAVPSDPPPYCLYPPTPTTALPPGRVDETEEDWSCSACTFLNNAALKNCEICEMPRVPSTLR